MSQDNLFKAMLPESEAKSQEQDEKVLLRQKAKKEEMQRMLKEGEKVTKYGKGTKKPGGDRFSQLAACDRHAGLIRRMVADELQTYSEAARAVSKLEGSTVTPQTLNLWCKRNGIKSAKLMAYSRLEPHLDEVRRMCNTGHSRAEIMHKFDVSSSTLGDFMKLHGLSTGGRKPAKLQIGGIKRNERY